MDDFDQFERSLAAALRSDADQSLARFEPATVARAAMTATQRGRLRLPWNTVRPKSNRWALVAAAVIGVLAIGGTLLLNRTGQPIVGGPTPGTEFSPGLPSLSATPSPTPTASDLREPSAAPTASAVAGPAGAWVATGTMGTPRSGHTAARLLDGRVLVVGGTGDENDTSAELYDPNSGSWSATGQMLRPQAGPAALLRDGRVLVVDAENPEADDPIYGAELYDPASGTWTTTGDMVNGGESTATLLRDGRVLVIGYNDTGEVYDPASGTWTVTGKMTDPRHSHAAVLLPDGKVLVAGGHAPGDEPTASAELYDPDTGSWTAIANMPAKHGSLDAFLQPDGKVLVLGASRGNPHSVELYDPATGAWTAKGDMSGAFAYQTATLLADGTLLLAGGMIPDEAEAPMTLAQLYDPRTGTWIATGTMLQEHNGSAATLLLDGTVLLAGGTACPGGDADCFETNAAELYIPAGVTPPDLGPFPSPTPIPTPTPSPTPPPVPPAVGPVPPNARSWTVTVDNRSSEPATLFQAEEGETGVARLCGNVTPNVVPAGVTMKVTFLLPPQNVTSCWIWVNPVPGEGGSFFPTSDAPLPGSFHIDEGGQVMWG